MSYGYFFIIINPPINTHIHILELKIPPTIAVVLGSGGGDGVGDDGADDEGEGEGEGADEGDGEGADEGEGDGEGADGGGVSTTAAIWSASVYVVAGGVTRGACVCVVLPGMGVEAGMGVGMGVEAGVGNNWEHVLSLVFTISFTLVGCPLQYASVS